jgi:hypothetical protein
MPTGFDPWWIVRGDRVHQHRGLWQGDADFLDAALKLVASPDLVVLSRLDQIDRSIAFLCLRRLGRRRCLLRKAEHLSTLRTGGDVESAIRRRALPVWGERHVAENNAV